MHKRDWERDAQINVKIGPTCIDWVHSWARLRKSTKELPSPTKKVYAKKCNQTWYVPSQLNICIYNHIYLDLINIF